MFGVCVRYGVRGADADDAIQDGCLRAWNARASFVRGTNFRGWLARIVANGILSVRRRSWRSVAVDPQEYDFGLSVAPDAEDRIELKRVLAIPLSRQQRQALTLIAIHGLSYEAAALEEGTDIGTIKSRVARARRLCEVG